MKKLFLVDVSSIFFRAFFALPPLTNEKGMPTNALYGFMSMTLKLLRDIKPDYLVFCFDTKEPSFRNEMYELYKANREEMPSDLIPQVPYVKKLTELLGIPILEMPGFEADDLIGTLTKKGLENHCQVVIVSGDKDFAQLVNQKVIMLDTMKDVTYDVDGVIAKWGVRPEQMIDYLALVGDSSDNIPGVKGIGPKGAQKLLHQFGTLEGIYQHLDEVPGKALKAKLEESKGMAFLSQKLVTIHQDINIPQGFEDFKLRPIAREELRSTLLDLGFKTFVRNILGDGDGAQVGNSSSSSPTLEASQEAIASVAPASGQMRTVREKNKTRIEEEWSLEDVATMVEPYSEVMVITTERGIYIGSGQVVARISGEPGGLGKVLSSKLIKWTGFDLKEIWHQVQAVDPIPGWDMMLASYVLKPRSVGGFAEVYKEETGEAYPDLPTPIQMLDCYERLQTVLKNKLDEAKGKEILEKFELPLAPVLYAMEKRGILIDVKELREQSSELGRDLRQLEEAIFAEAGGTFNIASPKQLAEILFHKLKLTPGKKTKTGYSTDSEVLEKLLQEHPIAQLILDYRELAKLKSTYVDTLPALINPQTERLHTHFNQAGTTTGRLSSQNPNLQNIPIRTERGRAVRKAFIAKPGALLLSADYSQIELRILAHMSGDEALIRAFSSDQDIHSATAAEVFSVPLHEVSPELRRKAKAINFGIAYGQGAFGLSESLGISRGEAAEIIGRYFQRFSHVKEYMDSVVKEAVQVGYVTTMFGRRRYITELASKSMAVKKFGERAAINAPIQGSASDLVKLAMIQLYQDLEWPMLLQVHDELVFEVPEDEVDEAKGRIKEIMEGVCSLKVPLIVNVGSGPNWEQAH